ncbi:hypothetical protein M885DRAFT_539094 [Pelagophyceae sp. CCMP2097]|nr:hypothetical protein M885DRAFT_539094 [Pelagophyceae sp. CCMP2097]
MKMWSRCPEASTAGGGAPCDMTEFRGKVLLITGAGGQFGREGGLYFGAELGCKLVLLDVAAGPLSETRAAVVAAGAAECDVLEALCDVTSPASVDAAVAAALARFGRIDLLWNNAGYQGKMAPVLDYDAADFKLVMDINVVGVFNVLQAVGRAMAAQNPPAPAGECLDTRATGLAIVNTASLAGTRGSATMCAYVASKAAVIGFTMSAARDLAKHGIRVNAISPGLIGPGMMWDRQNELQFANAGLPSADALAKQKLGQTAMKRLGSFREVVQTVAFLLSTQSGYTTGTNMVIDGGWIMR